jgi:hypothetical protein
MFLFTYPYVFLYSRFREFAPCTDLEMLFLIALQVYNSMPSSAIYLHVWSLHIFPLDPSPVLDRKFSPHLFSFYAKNDLRVFSYF